MTATSQTVTLPAKRPGLSEAGYYWSLNEAEARFYRIQRRAYFLSKEPGRGGKTPIDNWLEAERYDDRDYGRTLRTN